MSPTMFVVVIHQESRYTGRGGHVAWGSWGSGCFARRLAVSLISPNLATMMMIMKFVYLLQICNCQVTIKLVNMMHPSAL